MSITHSRTRRSATLCGALLLSLLPCLAGGARLVDNAGNPMRWPDGIVLYHPDSAALGRLDNVEARQLLAEAFMVWAGPYFSDAIESGDNGWTSQPISGTNAWSRTDVRFVSPFSSWFVPDVENIGDTLLVMPMLSDLPSDAELRFRHFVNTEDGYDGGVLEYSTNGTTWLDAAALITSGGYRDTISTCCGNPLGGRSAWEGDLGGWQDVVVDLTSLATQDVTFRWRLGTDGSVPGEGWYVDDVRVSPAGFGIAFREGGAMPAYVSAQQAWDLLGAVDGFSPVIFDTDGTITDYFGVNARFDVLGISTIDTPLGAGPIAEAGIIINGAFYDGLGPENGSPPDLPSVEALEAVMVHEVGHFLNLDHSLVHIELSDDGNPANDVYLPSMYPFDLDRKEEAVTPTADDIASLLTIYDPPAPASTISGTVEARMMPGGALEFFQGAMIVARSTSDPLRHAYSTLSGARYFPCNPGPNSIPNPCPPVSFPADGGSYELGHLAPGLYDLCVEQPHLALSSFGTRFDIPVMPGPEQCVSNVSPGSSIFLGVPEHADTHPGSEPDDTPAQAVALAVGVGQTTVVAGTIESNDTDFWSLEVVPNDVIRLDVESAEIGLSGRCATSGMACVDDSDCAAGEACVPLDAVLAVYDDLGVALVDFAGEPLFADDSFDPDSGDFSLDPYLEIQSDFTGTLHIGVNSYPDTGQAGSGGLTAGPYWLEIERVADNDADGWPDSTDNCPATANPTQTDFDGDRLGDACDDDDDDDGLSDMDEGIALTDPFDPDTDGDGVLDGAEVQAGSNPLGSDPLVPFGGRTLVSTAGTTPTSVTEADLDGDGDSDLLVSSFADDTIAWLENLDGRGTLGNRRIVNAAAAGARHAVAADVDGDGDLDVLTASATDSTIGWHANDGSGGFGVRQTIATPGDALLLAPVDVDLDGDVDVVAAVDTLAGGNPAWYENLNGAGTSWFEHVIEFRVDYPTTVAVADLDRDGDPDVVAGWSLDQIAWYENTDGNGSFGVQQNVSIQVQLPRSVVIADFDDDGDPDIASASFSDNKVAWYANNGSGSFGAQQVLTTLAAGAQWVAAGDVDGDGGTDLLSAAYGNDEIRWYQGSGSGLAGIGDLISTEADGPLALAVVDLDADGDLDVASASILDDEIAWYENRTLHRSAAYLTALPVTVATLGPSSVSVGDLDADGKLDLVSTSSSDNKIAWYHNDGAGGFDPQQVISLASVDPSRARPADIDEDGDLDIVSASFADDEIAWYENLGGGTFGAQQVIESAISGATDVIAADFDGDADLDLAFAAFNGDFIAWARNLGGGNFAPATFVTTLVNGPLMLVAADIDDDGDLDLASASIGDNKLAWYANTDGAGTWGAQQVVSTAGAGLRALAAADVDRDGDRDLLAASEIDGEIAWFENTDGAGSFGPQRLIYDLADGAIAVRAADVDHDGDLDVLTASRNNDEIAWFENTDGRGSFGPRHLVTAMAVGAVDVAAADLDDDGDIDLVSVWQDADTIAWFENQGGEYRAGAGAINLTAPSDGQVSGLLRFSVTHLGREGDPGLNLNGEELIVSFEESRCDISGEPCLTDDDCLVSGGGSCSAVPLDQAEGTTLFDKVEIYVDTGSGEFEEAQDTLVAQTPPTLFGGEQTFLGLIDSSDPRVKINAGQQRSFFVSVKMKGDASSMSNAIFRASLLKLEVVDDGAFVAPAVEEMPQLGVVASLWTEPTPPDSPTVQAIVPLGAVDVPLSTPVIVTMSEPVDPATVHGGSIYVEEKATQVKVSSDVKIADVAQRTIVLRRASDGVLKPATTYRIVVTNQIMDLDDGLSTVAQFFEFDTTGIDSTGALADSKIGNSGPDNLAGDQLPGQQAGEQSGTAVDVIGDLDGDNISEVLIGAPAADSGKGRVRVVFGGKALQSTQGSHATVELFQSGASAGLGTVVAHVGDVGGPLGVPDGVSDFLIGEPNHDGGRGRIYLIFGDDFSVTPSLDLAALTSCVAPLCGRIFEGEAVGDRAGAALALAGDTDGVGADDLLIGAPQASPPAGAAAGKAYLVPGPFAPGSINLSSVKSLVGGVEFRGESAGDNAGAAVSEWREQNVVLDGKDDLLIGAPGASTTESGAGKVYAIWGGGALTSQAAASGGLIDLSRVANGQGDEVSGVVFLGSTAGGAIGQSVSGAVDTNGDGTPEVIFGANGEVYKVNGKPPKRVTRTSSAGKQSIGPATLGKNLPPDVFDGFEATVFRAGAEGAPGGLVVHAAGDVNADGTPDLVIGAPEADPPSLLDAGKAFVVYGGPYAFLEPEQVLSDIGRTISGLVIQGTSAGDQLGRSVAGGLDVNGDGVDDTLVGAPFADPPLADAGATYVLSPLAPAEVTGLLLDRSGGSAVLEWNKPDRALAYHVYRGEIPGLFAIGELRTSVMDPLPDAMTCALTTDADMDQNPDTIDPDVPPSGSVYAYLVTGRNRIGEGPLDSTGFRTLDAQCDDND